MCIDWRFSLCHSLILFLNITLKTWWIAESLKTISTLSCAFVFLITHGMLCLLHLCRIKTLCFNKVMSYFLDVSIVSVSWCIHTIIHTDIKFESTWLGRLGKYVNRMNHICWFRCFHTCALCWSENSFYEDFV
jgi:hypothetical protein